MAALEIGDKVKISKRKFPKWGEATGVIYDRIECVQEDGRYEYQVVFDEDINKLANGMHWLKSWLVKIK